MHEKRSKYAAASGVARGGYVLADAPDGKPDVLLLASGSEVSLCLDARERLEAAGIKARVVSMPSAGPGTSAPPDTVSACVPSGPPRR